MPHHPHIALAKRRRPCVKRLELKEGSKLHIHAI
jgi:hypothetical protein